MKYFFIGSAFLVLVVICAMQRFALRELREENAIIRNYAARTFIDAALAEIKNEPLTENVPPAVFLPEPHESVAKDVIARIDMLQDHYKLDGAAYPACDWATNVLKAARNEIVHLKYVNASERMLGACPYVGAAAR